ncbi:type II methionyl aminopeptidase [archaeon]|jgi:methionyl aminopeptidase|nr:type II methionyl aminopeptidase [archaeon]MBT4273148.1 type II methionyl aminopeptidase [archaeon]MBT4461373.1 type II methionyl aminopeptidase [archaeon]MBT4858881.1 type II methionyl aminopeptidase [archaeon]MBT5423451.1 type II methionyl aminopeptidase [archaeon]
MDERDKYIEAGKISATALKKGASLIKINAKLLDVTEAVEKIILDNGGEFTFPPQISLNEIAAHYCADPDDETVFKKGDIAKLDCGAMVDGYPGDNATTIDLGDNKKLVDASRDALNNALDIIKPGITLSEIGRTIQDTITKAGYAPVKNLSGHGLSRYKYHDKPSIPNFDTGDQTQLTKGQVIAIEPFASNGSGMIFETNVANLFAINKIKPVRNPITRNVLKEIQSFNNMPFTTRWLTKKFHVGKVNFALRELLQKNILNSYPPLPDTQRGYISQAEHTVIVDDEIIVTTRI